MLQKLKVIETEQNNFVQAGLVKSEIGLFILIQTGDKEYVNCNM